MSDTRIAAQYRTAPHNIELEQALLGAILVNNEAFYQVSDFLEPQHFFEPIHQKLYEVAASLVRVGKAATPITLKTFLPADTDVAGLTASQYLARLAAEATTVINAYDYGRNICDLSIRRSLIGIGEEMVNAAYNCPIDASPNDQIEETSRRLFDLSAAGSEKRSRRASEVIDAVVERFTRVMTGEAVVESISTGLHDLDRLIGGFNRGDLVVAAGRPGMGKSTIGSAITRNAAMAGYGCLFFSLEMSEEHIGTRMLADHAFDGGETRSPIVLGKILRADLTNSEAERLSLVARDFKDLPIVIDPSGYLTATEILARARALKLSMAHRGKSLDLIVIDYLKFVRPSSRYQGQRHYEVGEITAALKTLAKDLDVCVLLLAQLNRETERRQDKRPQLADLRESGDIEADADLVLLLYREAYYLENNPEVLTNADLGHRFHEKRYNLEIIVAKNRMGPVGSVEVFFHPGCSAIRNAAR
jgi:replicative DNA helicase